MTNKDFYKRVGCVLLALLFPGFLLTVLMVLNNLLSR